jgi:tetratricopeptide (TPR) repeat protein
MNWFSNTILTMNCSKNTVAMMAVSVILLICTPSVDAQSKHKQLREGDLFYEQGEFLEAEEAYRKANETKSNAQAQYNLGNAIYQQERYEEAIRQFESAAESSADPMMKSQAYYNLGNTHFKAQALDKSVEAYKNALRLNPNDTDTKKNLTLALQKLQQQQQQQQQQQDKQEGGEEDKQQQQQPQPAPQDQEKQKQQQSAQGNEDSQQTEAKESMTKAEAEELLRIIDNEDSQVQEKLRKSSSNPNKPKKDW